MQISKKSYPIDKDRRSKWQGFARQHNASLQNLTLVALKVLYSKLFRLDGFVLGVITHGRHSNERNTPGLYSSYLAVALDANLHEGVENALKTINRQLRTSYRHMDYPMGQLAREFDSQDNFNRMFDVIINELSVDLRMIGEMNWNVKLKPSWGW